MRIGLSSHRKKCKKNSVSGFVWMSGCSPDGFYALIGLADASSGLLYEELRCLDADDSFFLSHLSHRNFQFSH